MIVYQWECHAPASLAPCSEKKPGHFRNPESRRRSNEFFCGSTNPHIRCDGDGCEKTVKLNHWGMIRAGSLEGWFFRKGDSEAYCFDHLPDWVVPWRDWNNPGWRERLRKELAEKLPSVKRPNG